MLKIVMLTKWVALELNRMDVNQSCVLEELASNLLSIGYVKARLSKSVRIHRSELDRTKSYFLGATPDSGLNET